MLGMTTPAPLPPYLFVDAYPFDYDNPRTTALEDPPWIQILASPMIRGAILKASDGARYGYTAWFVRNFVALSRMLGAQRGSTMLIGGYHYTQFFANPREQAEAYCSVMEAAGLDGRDIMPIVDVEGGGERSANRRASAAQVVECVSGVVERIKELTGRRVMLYGRGLMRDLEIATRMGCDCVWNPSYTKMMVTNGLTKIGSRLGPWTIDDLVLWQYEGDGVADVTVTHLPTSIAGLAKMDLSVAIDGPRAMTWPRVVERLT